MTARWKDQAAAHAEKIFAKHQVKLTLGGEPTYVPLDPVGPEWTYSAVGPSKLQYAWKVAANLQQDKLKGSAAFFCPGKSYPGEPNPRWVIKLLSNRDGTPLFHLPAKGKPLTTATLQTFADHLSKELGIPSQWVKFADPTNAGAEVLATPLDHENGSWRSGRWPLEKGARKLFEVEGPAGLRLPLHTIPQELARRALTIDHSGTTISVFFPPLLQTAFLELLAAVQAAAKKSALSRVELAGYVPSDEEKRWTSLGLAADPGVLEINLPACANWGEYSAWLTAVTTACEQAGLRSWKESPWDHPQGSGGGNHFLWGGPSLDEHPFFTRPAWLAGVLRFWQHHPSLAYLFTGCYVGASSQAPRPDESARDLYDINMAYTFLETLPAGDHRQLINETLRHLQTDVTGNAHRSEISFDKFWNPSWPAGALGLIEFRAIESLPHADWMDAIPLLWNCIAAHLLETKPPGDLKRFGTRLLDEYFLPTPLLNDLHDILDALKKSGFKIDAKQYREIWSWRFPSLLDWKRSGAKLIVRKALESWPLLCETPVEGGTTSRFVDTSMQRLEFCANEDFQEQYDIYIAGRPLGLRETGPDEFLRGLRYRRTNLYPSLHPGIPTQLPLQVTLVDKKNNRVAANFQMGVNQITFQPLPNTEVKLGGRPCRGGRKGDLTCDLRLD